MYQEYYRLAGRLVKICSQYEYVQDYCRAYVTEPKGDEELLQIQIEPSDIEYERLRSAKEDEHAGMPIREFSNPYLETLAVYRRLAEALLVYDTVLFHGSVIAVDKKAYLFTAKSGTGKSTHTRLWREYFGDRAVMVNDDKPLLQIADGEVLAYGTPWDGKHRLSSNISVPLHGICVLHRAVDNQLVKADKKEIYPLLLQQIYRPRDAENMLQTMKLLDKLMDMTPLYSLYCNMQPDAARVAYEGMQE